MWREGQGEEGLNMGRHKLETNVFHEMQSLLLPKMHAFNHRNANKTDIHQSRASLAQCSRNNPMKYVSPLLPSQYLSHIYLISFLIRIQPASYNSDYCPTVYAPSSSMRIAPSLLRPRLHHPSMLGELEAAWAKMSQKPKTGLAKISRTA